jgi:succinate dehydrogenase / fumarate reductase flavoprotein subunit
MPWDVMLPPFGKPIKKEPFLPIRASPQIHPTCIPVSGDHQSKLTLMSESLRNDGRIWVPKKKGETRKPTEIPDEERDYYLERRYPAFGNLVPRDVASRAAKERCDAGYGVGASKMAVYLDYKFAIERYGKIEASKHGLDSVGKMKSGRWERKWLRRNMVTC